MKSGANAFRSLLGGTFILAGTMISVPGEDYLSPKRCHLTTCGLTYESILRERMGRTVSMRHWVHMDDRVTSEVTEIPDSSGALQDRRVVVHIHGRSGAPIGRLIATDTGSPAQFYVKNHLGSTVRVVNADGSFATTPAFDYQSFGEPRVLREDSLHPTGARFTGKEFDTRLDLYFFGARWYDPGTGMWISPDPARQFANPYGYADGSPLLLVDPDGLWSLGLGIVVGYDRHGWHVGAGVAVDVDLGIVSVDVTSSHVWSQDGTQTSSVGAGGGIQLGVAGGNIGAGGSYNTRDGYSLNARGGLNIAGVGTEIGTHQAWDRHRDYLGGDVYAEGYVGIKGVASYGVGYAAGWGEFESGFYQSGSFMMNSLSNHGDGWRYGGFEATTWLYNHDSRETSDFNDRPDMSYGTPEKNRGNWFGSSFIGPDNPESYSGAVLTSDIDLLAYGHDKRFDANEAKGPFDALYSKRAGVMHADRILTSRSLGTLFRYTVGGGNREVDVPVTRASYRAALGVGLLYTALNNAKSSSHAY